MRTLKVLHQSLFKYHANRKTLCVAKHIARIHFKPVLGDVESVVLLVDIKIPVSLILGDVRSVA